jgi:hypothetical protein
MKTVMTYRENGNEGVHTFSTFASGTSNSLVPEWRQSGREIATGRLINSKTSPLNPKIINCPDACTPGVLLSACRKIP